MEDGAPGALQVAPLRLAGPCCRDGCCVELCLPPHEQEGRGWFPGTGSGLSLCVLALTPLQTPRLRAPRLTLGPLTWFLSGKSPTQDNLRVSRTDHPQSVSLLGVGEGGWEPVVDKLLGEPPSTSPSRPSPPKELSESSQPQARETHQMCLFISQTL